MCATILLSVALFAAALVDGSQEVQNSASCTLEQSQYNFYRGEVALKSEGLWEIADIPPGGDPAQLYLFPPATEEILMPGRRMRAVQADRNIRYGRNPLQNFFWPCKEYAKSHDNTGPSSIEDLDREKFGYIHDSVSRSPWGDRISVEVEGPFSFLLPDVRFEFEEDSEWIRPENRRILAVELRPFVDDGKHYVLYTDGSCIRAEIDQGLVEKYGLEIRPVIKNEDLQYERPPETLTYVILAVRDKGASGPFPVSLRNTYTGESLDIEWDPSSCRQDEKAVMEAIQRARGAALLPYAAFSGSPLVQTWLNAYHALGSFGGGRGRARPQESMSAFGVLGGRAAVRETLQMEALNLSRDQDTDRAIPVDSIEGVKVQSHPYEEMLGGAEGGRLAMADLIPMDRFFVYAAKPSAIMPFFDKGAEFLSHLGAAITGNAIKYHLEEKYLARLGLNEQWLKGFLESGAVEECALMVPDLFFIDSTEVTAVSRLAQPEIIEAMLKLLGISGLSGGGIKEIALRGGGSAFFALEGDLLCISTSRSELESVLRLKESGGRGSLGRSAEFRYMLTELPVKEETRMYAYFSDPFIRRLVGPETKIAQYRRMKARAEMEYLTSCALLAVMDGIRDPGSLEFLVERDYVPEQYLNGEYTLGRDFTFRSKTYGTLNDLKTLCEVPVDKVTQREAEAYKAYVDSYTRYWRRFFDPIAVRLDDTADGALEATTFILPLIDNTFYNALGEWMNKREDGVPLKAPKLAPEPVLMVSVNLKETAWRSLLDDMAGLFEHYIHVSPAVLDDLGPGLHLALMDADPVIALGSGDLLGTLSVNLTGGGGDEMMMIPLILSVLTRPCTLLVETQDPQKTRRFLRQAALSGDPSRGRRSDELSVAFYQVDGRDAWVCSLDIMGLMKLRYGLEVQGDFLLVKNIPWSNDVQITRVENAPLNGARLDAYPKACLQQLPGLHAAASDQSRAAALQGMGYLYPMLASGFATLKDVEKRYDQLFGFHPVHPGEGEWIWDGSRLSSSRYGSVFRQKQPGHERGDRDFGILKDLDLLHVGMQFEESGLRTTIRWKLRK